MTDHDAPARGRGTAREAIERYMRSGQHERLLRENDGDGGFPLPRDWVVQNIPVEKRQLYAMASATQSILSDPKINLRQWLLDEIEPRYKEQVEGFDGATIGPIRILRDPYSAKPYVLFYATAEAIRPLAALNSQPAEGAGWKLFPAKQTMELLKTLEHFFNNAGKPGCDLEAGPFAHNTLEDIRSVLAASPQPPQPAGDGAMIREPLLPEHLLSLSMTMEQKPWLIAVLKSLSEQLGSIRSDFFYPLLTIIGVLELDPALAATALDARAQAIEEILELGEEHASAPDLHATQADQLSSRHGGDYTQDAYRYRNQAGAIRTYMAAIRALQEKRGGTKP